MNIKILLMIVLTFSVSTVFAQGGPPATPIDGGLISLLVAGGLFGVKKIKELKN